MTKLDEFNQYFSTNYNDLRNLSIKICGNKVNIGEEVLHSSYEKIQKYIDRNGFEGNNYLNFISRSLKNMYLDQIKIQSKTILYDNSYITDEDNNKDLIIDNASFKYYNDNLNEQIIYNDFIKFKQIIYKYVEDNFNMIEAAFFKYRYMNGYSFEQCRIKQPNGKYGYSKDKIFKIIKRINIQIRDEFKTFNVDESYIEYRKNKKIRIKKIQHLKIQIQYLMSKKLEEYTPEQQVKILTELLMMQNASNLHLQEVVKGQDQELLQLTTKVNVLETKLKNKSKKK